MSTALANECAADQLSHVSTIPFDVTVFLSKDFYP
jgi:hypothetical protein